MSWCDGRVELKPASPRCGSLADEQHLGRAAIAGAPDQVSYPHFRKDVRWVYPKLYMLSLNTLIAPATSATMAPVAVRVLRLHESVPLTGYQEVQQRRRFEKTTRRDAILKAEASAMQLQPRRPDGRRSGCARGR
jgi:hypothetical protein